MMTRIDTTHRVARLALLAGVLLLGACGTSQAPLRELAAVHGLPFGASVNEQVFAAEPGYRAVLAREFSKLTPENALKFERVHPAPGRYDFTMGDRLVDFAGQHGMQVHGHTLLWHQQLPAWLTTGDYSSEELRAILREHIHTVVGHYRGRIAVWDVVSEAIDDDGQLRETFWLRGIGPDYIALAFHWAHEADPDARLLYNDYGNEGSNAKSTAIMELLAGLRREGVPVHGVGMQMHLSSDYAPGALDTWLNMQRLRLLGLEVHITEMDVALRVPADEAALQRQADIYRAMLGACLNAGNCKSFALWGFTDRYSWVPEFFPGWGAALPLDETYRPKLAYEALQGALR